MTINPLRIEELTKEWERILKEDGECSVSEEDALNCIDWDVDVQNYESEDDKMLFKRGMYVLVKNRCMLHLLFPNFFVFVMGGYVLFLPKKFARM